MGLIVELPSKDTPTDHREWLASGYDSQVYRLGTRVWHTYRSSVYPASKPESLEQIRDYQALTAMVSRDIRRLPDVFSIYQERSSKTMICEIVPIIRTGVMRFKLGESFFDAVYSVKPYISGPRIGELSDDYCDQIGLSVHDVFWLKNSGRAEFESRLQLQAGNLGIKLHPANIKVCTGDRPNTIRFIVTDLARDIEELNYRNP